MNRRHQKQTDEYSQKEEEEEEEEGEEEEEEEEEKEGLVYILDVILAIESERKPLTYFCREGREKGREEGRGRGKERRV